MHFLEIPNTYFLLHTLKLAQNIPACGQTEWLSCAVNLGLWLIPVFILHAGVLYLQYGDETKQLRMPNEITSADTIRALFVSAFPQQLTMKMLESPSVAIYIKDESRNVYYELNDVR